MENKGDMVLTFNGGILDYDGLLDALLNNGYTIIMNKVGAYLYLNYKFNSDDSQSNNLFTDKDGDVWEWCDNAWHCISGDESQTERGR